MRDFMCSVLMAGGLVLEPKSDKTSKVILALFQKLNRRVSCGVKSDKSYTA